MTEASAGLGEAAAYVGAWGVMMAAMMLPSATPLILLYGAVHRGMESRGQRGIPAALFALTYLVVWAVLGVPVYAAGRLIDGLAAASPSRRGSAAVRGGRPAGRRPASTSSRRSSARVFAAARVRWDSSSATGAMATSARSGWRCGTRPTAPAAAGR